MGGVAAHDRPVFDRWVTFCADHDLGEVVVDVVAGTSAGGLNGTLLATAVARGASLDPPSGDSSGPWLRSLWLEAATLQEGKLIRSREAPAQPSVLDGDFFRSSIDRALVGLSAAEQETRREPVTLFVTATALGRADSHYRDSFAQPFDVPDHRRLFRFPRSESDAVAFHPRGGDPDATWWTRHVVDAFSGDAATTSAQANLALAAAARASASFPFAFTPVQEPPELAARRVRPPSAVEPDGGGWLVDGGILDNAPFQPVLDAITRRPLTRQVRRLLVYVVPSGGTSGPSASTSADLPTWGSIGTSVISFPSESDIRDDLVLADDLVTRAEGRTAAPEARFRETVQGNSAMVTAAASLLPQYRAARVVGGLLEVRATLASALPERVSTLAPRSVDDAEKLLLQGVPWLPGEDGDPSSAYGQVAWEWGLAAAERVVRLMVRDLRANLADAREGAAGLATISQFLNKIEAVRDAFREVLVADAASAPADDPALLTWTSERFTRLRVREALAWCVRSAADAYTSTLSVDGGPAGAVRAGLAVEISTQAFTAYQPFTRTAPFHLLRLGPDIETPLVDADPDKAEDARAAGAHKLYGTHLRHFAAFGLPDWRQWDWTAGRLDAQTHLARALLTKAGEKPEMRRATADAWTAETQDRTVRAVKSAGVVCESYRVIFLLVRR